jgi:peptidoglycan/xylan/chitin deacetylase (PgdA/CDA1 family)
MKAHIKNTNQYLSLSTTALLIAFVMLVPRQVLSATNLITNGDFETADIADAHLPAGWISGHQFVGATTTYSYPVTGMNGNGAQTTHEAGMTNTDAKWYFTPVAIVSGKEYRFTDSYSATGPTEVTLEFFDSNNQHLTYAGFFSVPATPSSAWSSVDVLFAAPANAAYVTIFHSIKNGTLTVDDYVLSEVPVHAPVVFNKGLVTFAFDDGWNSQLTTGVTTLNNKNIKGSFYMISNAIDKTYDGYTSTDGLVAAQVAGNEIGAHTVYHCNLATGLCPDGPVPNAPDTLTVQQEIVNSRTTLTQAGMTPVETFVYPYGAYLSPQTTDLVASAGFIGARTIQEGYNDKVSNPYTLKTYIVDRNITAGNISRVKGWIDTAAQNHEWLILTFHQIEDANTIATKNLDGATTPEFFSQIVDYVAQKRDADQVVVKTMREVLTHCMDSDESDCVNPVPLDTTAPVITIDSYATSTTNQDLTVTAHTNEGTLNAATHTFIANGSFDFVATDAAGNIATSTVTITNIDKVAPTITLQGVNPQAIALGGTYIELGVTALDDVDGNITSTVTIDASAVNVNVSGTYPVTYTVTDAAGNVATTKTRTVQVAQRSLTLEAVATSKTYGTADPILTYTVASGTLQNGDSFTGTLSRTIGENLGVYPITIGTLSAGPNYALNFTSAPFTIVPPVCLKGYVLNVNLCVKKRSSGGGGGSGGTKLKTLPSKVLGVSTTTVAATTGSHYIFVTTMFVGSRGTEVIELQKRLTQEGVYTGPITGYFGPMTKAAVVKYQAIHGLPQVGIVGPMTRAVLNK